jgi:predicted metal-dependent phosphoesterase TrpH
VSGKEFGIPNQKIITVFNKDQIHILGSKIDIEKFKEFVSKN